MFLHTDEAQEVGRMDVIAMSSEERMVRSGDTASCGHKCDRKRSLVVLSKTQ